MFGTIYTVHKGPERYSVINGDGDEQGWLPANGVIEHEGTAGTCVVAIADLTDAEIVGLVLGVPCATSDDE